MMPAITPFPRPSKRKGPKAPPQEISTAGHGLRQGYGTGCISRCALGWARRRLQSAQDFPQRAAIPPRGEIQVQS